MLALSYDIGSMVGGPIVAAQIGQDFQDVVNQLGQLRSGDFATDAGIRATQLADRYNVYQTHFDLVPYSGFGMPTSATADIATIATWDPADRLGAAIAERLRISTSTESVIRQYRVRLRTGQPAWLCAVEIYRLISTAGATYPRITIYQNGSLIPGSTFDLTVDDDYTQQEGTPSPLDAPITAVRDGDIIEYRLTRSAAATVDVRGITVRETWKVQLTT